MLGLSIEDDSEASFEASTKTAGLQKVLKQLPKIFDDDEEFYNTVLKSYKKKLKYSDFVKVFKSSEIKDAVMEVFDTNKLLQMLNEKINENNDLEDSKELQQLLKHVFASSVIKHVKEPNQLKSMFKVITENFEVLELTDLCNEAIKTGIRRLQK